MARFASCAWVSFSLSFGMLAGCAYPSSSSSSTAAATTATAARVAPATFALPIEPNGLWWDAPTATLYFASDDEHALYRWKAGSFPLPAALPAASGRPGLGQPVRTPDGRTFVPRFGHGDGGGVL